VTAGGSTTHTWGPGVNAPIWVALVRSGATLTAYVSADGQAWAAVGSEPIAMGSTVQVGLALTSHDDSTRAIATFDNVSVTAAPGPGLPPPWTSADVGVVGLAGSTVAVDGIWTVRGSGADVWDTADGFHYAYRPLTGDGTIVARVASLAGVDPWVKAGVMVRDALTPGSAHAFVFATPGSNGVAFQRRVTAGGSTTHTWGPGVNAPIWVALVRSGATLTAYASADGQAWTPIGSEPIPMGATVQVGLALTSHDDQTRATATFDNVSVAAATGLP
jgi:regulation of enolase protein 1 (concanavalin A-like superfamily)